MSHIQVMSHVMSHKWRKEQIRSILIERIWVLLQKDRWDCVWQSHVTHTRHVTRHATRMNVRGDAENTKKGDSEHPCCNFWLQCVVAVCCCNVLLWCVVEVCFCSVLLHSSEWHLTVIRVKSYIQVMSHVISRVMSHVMSHIWMCGVATVSRIDKS